MVEWPRAAPCAAWAAVHSEETPASPRTLLNNEHQATWSDKHCDRLWGVEGQVHTLLTQFKEAIAAPSHSGGRRRPCLAAHERYKSAVQRDVRCGAQDSDVDHVLADSRLHTDHSMQLCIQGEGCIGPGAVHVLGRCSETPCTCHRTSWCQRHCQVYAITSVLPADHHQVMPLQFSWAEGEGVPRQCASYWHRCMHACKHTQLPNG